MLLLPAQLLPMLAAALEFGGAPSVALGALLQIGRTLDEAAFSAQVVPALSKLFASNDRTIRRSLLESIDSYGAHFTQARARHLYCCVHARACMRKSTPSSLASLPPLAACVHTPPCMRKFTTSSPAGCVPCTARHTCHATFLEQVREVCLRVQQRRQL